MMIIKQYFIILVCLLTGELLSYGFNIPIPGNVLGMVILVAALILGLIRLEAVERAADQLINNLALFFIPLVVGVVAYKDILMKYVLPITVSTVISTFLVLIITGYVTQILIKKEKDN